jgi:type I restriction enzyme S subunit
MSADWPEVRIEDIAAIKSNALATGPFGSAIGAKFFTESGIPVIRGSNLSVDIGIKLIDENLVFVSPEKAREFSRSIARRGDLVFTCWGTINQIGLIHSKSEYAEYVVSNKQMKLTVDLEKVDPKYVYYVFSSPDKQDEIISNGIGAAVPGFNLGQLRRHKFTLPPLVVQKSIVKILDALDTKIEVNRRINQTLEAMAQAIFKSWFVDFDPVKAKIAAIAEGRDPLRAAMSAISGKAEDELDALPPEQYEKLAATAALFPDELEASGIEGIPKGWKNSTLGEECAYLNRGISPKYLDEGGVLVINQKCVRDFSVDVSKARRHDPAQRTVSGRFLQVGDVLVNSTGVGTLGRIAQILRLDEPSIVDSHITVVRAGSRLNSAFLGQWFSTKQPEIEALGEGSTGQTELSRWKLAILPVLVPDEPVLAAFNLKISPMKALISTNDRESLVLRDTRDALLPKLLSGELSPQAALGDDAE